VAGWTDILEAHSVDDWLQSVGHVLGGVGVDDEDPNGNL